MASPKNLRKNAERPNLVRAWSLHASLSADKALCRPRRVPRPLFQLWCSPRTLRPPRQLTQRVVAGGEEEDKAKKPRTPRGGEEAIKEECAGEGDEEHEDGTTSHPDNGDRCRVRACMHTYLLTYLHVMETPTRPACMHGCTHAQTFACAHTHVRHTHAHTHTHTHTYSPPSRQR